MATTLDQLIVEIRADTKNIRKGLDDVNKKLKTTEKSTNKLSASFSKLGKGIGVATAAFAALQFGKFAFRTAVEFEDLRISLNQVFGSIEAGEKAFKQILDFAQTTPFQIETVSRAFIALKGAGIEPNIRQLQIFADTASTTTRQVEVFETFIRILQRSVAGGSVGLEELNQISDRGIDVFGALNRRLGLSRLEVTKFGQTAQGASAIMEALTDDLEETFGGAMQNKMDAMSTKMSNFEIAAKGFGAEIAETFFPLVKGFIDDITMGLNVATAGIKILKGEVADTGFVGPLQPETPPVDLETKLTADQAGFISQLNKLLEDAKPKIDTLNEQLDLTESLRGALDAKGELLFTDDQIEVALAHLNSLKDDLDDTKTFSDEMASAIQTLSVAFTQDFTDSLINGENALDSFKDFSKNMVSQIIAIFMQLAVVNQILNNIFGAGSFDTFDFKTGKIIPADNSAGGGTVQPNMPVLVGERGAEIFVPNTSGRIMNNMNTRNALGGGQPIVVNQSLNFATGVVPTVRAEVTKMLPQIADVTKGAVLESAMRGGAYRRGLTGG